MRIYRELTGDALTEPRASGGATYARAIDNCVAYGALTTYEELTEHQPNERAAMQNLYNAMEIYAHAVYELTR
jgi:acetylornithine deacetylase/succinyl-diaminopimelate desuccinylase-like protein